MLVENNIYYNEIYNEKEEFEQWVIEMEKFLETEEGLRVMEFQTEGTVRDERKI